MQHFSNVTVRRRIAIVFLGATVILIALMVRLTYLQVVRADHFTSLALNQRLRPVPLLAERGVIYDRGGNVLAASMSFEAAYVVPIEVVDAPFAARQLAPILSQTPETIEKKLTARKALEWLALRLTPDEADAIRRLDLPGVGVQERPLRYYPNGSLAAQLLGFAGIDNQGLEGIERHFEKYLKGQDGMIVQERDAAGRSIPGGIERRIHPTDGFDVVLTVDKVIQYVAEREIERGVLEADADWGLFIGVHPQTGEVLAVAHYPSFDPNEYGAYPPERWRNRAIADFFEPGSTFKVMTTAAALDAGVVTPDSTYVDPVTLNIGGGRVSCWRHGGHGRQNLVEALENSCNPIFSMIAEDLTGPRFHQYIDAFGFGDLTGIDFPGESPGTIPAANARLLTWANVGFGQGIGASALQMVMAVSSIANGGQLLQPYVVKEVKNGEGDTILTSSKKVLGRPISANTSAEMRNMMRSVVERGSGTLAEVPGYPTAGKTGTAQIAGPGGYLQGRKSNMAAFLAFAPYDDPQFAGIVMLYKVGQEPSYGGIWAAPVFGRIASEALEAMGIPRRDLEGAPDDGTVTVPNVRNLGIDDAKELLFVHGLEIAAEGVYGIVIEQTPPPGAKVAPGTNVRLTFYDEVTGTGGLHRVNVPDVFGRSMRDAAMQLSRAGLRIEIEGTGYAIRQEPKAGAEIYEGEAVKVFFSPPDQGGS